MYAKSKAHDGDKQSIRTAKGAAVFALAAALVRLGFGVTAIAGLATFAVTFALSSARFRRFVLVL